MSGSDHQSGAGPGATNANQSSQGSSPWMDTAAVRVATVVGILAGITAIISFALERGLISLILIGLVFLVLAVVFARTIARKSNGRSMDRRKHKGAVILLLAFTLIGGGLEGGIVGYKVASPAQDKMAPSTPAGLRASRIEPSHVDLSWTKATDNVEVRGYVVLRDGKRIADVNSTPFSDTTVEPQTHYAYMVEAFDAAGNHSAPSDPVPVSIPARVTITSPAGGEKLPESFPVSGTYRDLRPGEEIWVLVNPEGLGFYPQNGPARAVPGSGLWQNENISLGGVPGTTAEIRVVVVTSHAMQSDFRDFVSQCRQGCPRLKVLPDGVEPGVAVNVTKR